MRLFLHTAGSGPPSSPDGPRARGAARGGVRGAGGVLVWAVVIAAAAAQDSTPASRPAQAPLLERQRLIRERVRELESRMVKLTRMLSRSEPEKAQRLRDALEFAGRKRVRARVEQIAALVERGELGEAERAQVGLLRDLDALLARMTSSLNDAERRRTLRRKLQAFKQTLRGTIEAQTRLLMRTRDRASRPAEPRTPRSEPTLERDQRELRRRVRQLRSNMHDDEDTAGMTAPATKPMDEAAEQMRRAAEALAKRAPAKADPAEQEALDRLQQALDALEQALRQVRREEREETLAALETRITSMLVRERDIRAAVERVAGVDADKRGRLERMQITEAVGKQAAVRSDCEVTLRILLDEGTTVIVPELLRQTAGDMGTVAERLDRSDVSAPTRRLVEDIIASLEEILHAVEKKQQQDAERAPGGGQQGEDQTSPLLPGSAELKLLRAAQLRINRRTTELARADADKDVIARKLAGRQRRLAELARKMNER